MAPIAWTIGASLPAIWVGSSVRSHGQSIDHGLTKIGEGLSVVGIGIGIGIAGGMIGAAIIIKK